MSRKLVVIADRPVLIVNIETPWVVENLLQQIYVIRFSCGQQPLICGGVASGYVSAHEISSIRDILLEAISKEVRAKGRARQ